MGSKVGSSTMSVPPARRCAGFAPREKRAAAGTNSVAKCLEDGQVVAFGTVADRREHVEGSVEAALGQGRSQIVPEILQAIRGQIAAILFGLRKQLRGLIHPDDDGAAPSQGQRQPA